MRDPIVMLILMSVACWSPCAGADKPDCAVIGYLPEYRIEQVQPEHCRALTCLIYFGLKPQADGRIAASPVRLSVLKKLKAIKRLSRCRMLISAGGWERSDGFPALAGHQAARKRFITDVHSFCRQHGFDGVDYDWEHPKGAAELASYVRLLAETKAAFREDGLLVTVAQASWQNLGSEAYGVVDRIHLMAYDHDYPQATPGKGRADVERLIEWDCPPGKIALGLPFYGRNRTGMARTYAELVGTRQVDPDTDNIDGYAFNGRTTITAKVNFAMQRRLAGVMIWEVGQDTRRTDLSLLTTIDRQIRLRSRQSR